MGGRGSGGHNSKSKLRDVQCARLDVHELARDGKLTLGKCGTLFGTGRRWSRRTERCARPPYEHSRMRTWTMSVNNPSVSATKPATVSANDSEHRKGRLKSIGGSQSDHWNNTLANQAVQALWLENSSPEERDKQLSATVAALMGVAPKDELEGMMAAQLIAAHNAAMECFRRAMIGEQTTEGRRENLAQANKLSRTFATLLEALNRHRGKGQQKVTVEHVHVHSGGQAIVGTVESPTPVNSSTYENQNDARQITHTSQPAMRSPNAEPELVPSASDAERPLPYARRKITGRTEG